MSSVLVTGATGFIGSHLVEALLELGNQVRCLVRPSSNLQWLPRERVALCSASLASGDGLAKALEGAHTVFHLAGATKARTYPEYHRSNVESLRTLLDAVRKHAPGLRRFVYLSSQAAAGPSPAGVMDETAACAPLTYYGESKLAAEKLLAGYPDIPGVVLRSVSVYGPRDRDFLTLVKSMKLGVAPILGTREKRLTFVHVADVVQALILAAKSPAAAGRTYFITDGRVYTWDETRRIIEKVVGRKALEIRVPLPVIWATAAIADSWSRVTGTATIINLNRMREFRQANWACSSERLQAELKFRPRYDLESGLRQTIAWARENGWI